MITNSGVTIYHKGFDETTRLETWRRFTYQSAWVFGGRGAGINRGYDNANDVQVRIPYDSNSLDINNFAIGDIIVQGTATPEIQTQQDLTKFITYNITSISNNNFGYNQHIHLGGK